MSRNKHNIKKLRACCCCSLTFSWVVAHRLCLRMFISESCSPRVLSSNKFHFTWTTKQKLTRNLHSFAQLFAVASWPITSMHIFLPHAIKYHKTSACEVNGWLFHSFWPPSRQICQLHYQASVPHEVFHVLQVFKISFLCYDAQTPPHI